jgi:Domain of unknown function (DUF6265)
MMSLKLVSAAALALSLAACASGPPPRDLGKLAFMVGCWKSADGVNLEVWSPPEGGIMFGYATTTKAGTTELVGFEQSRIDIRPGRATYTASPDGQRPVVFTETKPDPLALVAPNTVTFENADHDYPQRITYQATKEGLAAAVSKLDGSRQIPYAWARCKD